MTETQMQCKECGERLASTQIARPHLKKMSRILDQFGKVSYRDTLDNVILICLQAEVDAQCLINAMGDSEEEQKKSLQYFFAGYNSK